MNRLKNIVKLTSVQLLTIKILSVTCYVFAFYFLFKYLNIPKYIFLIFSFLILALGSWKYRIFSFRKEDAIRFLHRKNKSLEYSLPLLYLPESNTVESLQIERISQQKDLQIFEFPKALLVPMLFLGLGIGISFLPKKISGNENSLTSIFREKPEDKPVNRAPEFFGAKVKLSPPPYTGLKTSNSDDLNFEAITGTNVIWEVRFSHSENLNVYLENASGLRLSFEKKPGSFIHIDKLIASGFYSIKAIWRDSLVYQSPLYRLEALPDAPPQIEPTSRELYSVYVPKSGSNISISAKIADDFKVSNAFLVATVARGSGENVKFREVKWPVGGKNFKSEQITKNIDLKGLNFSPGDELYYYWAAFDNRLPEPNFSKSDTYFLVYRDTTNQDETEPATMAMNILPEYFRSQRQIIIDTEKLIKKRKKIAAQAFKSESNEIGYDQKVLRLRYGQYLGEEFEDNIGHVAHGGESGNILEGFVHAHDSEEQEDNHVEAEHPHEHEHTGQESQNEDPLAALMEQFVHSHDDAETNTFYEQSTRSLLKMALEQMWQSELHLRLYEPEKALPFENKALEYLKEAQQKARTYVKKSGFDPPPIKEKEKRLTGELTKYNARKRFMKAFSAAEIQILAAETIDILEKNKLTDRDKVKLARLAQAFIQAKSLDKKWVSVLQKLINGQNAGEEELKHLQNGLLNLSGRQSGEIRNNFENKNKALRNAYRSLLQ
ncbi:MAG: hypothetical protein U0V04_07265 [Spirosomataceae bacterium]|jgi:hypothetical protein